MKHLNIPDLPSNIDELLYDYHRAEILKRIESPIVCMFEEDPDWDLIDRLLVAENNVLDLSKNGEIQVTVHELLPGVNAVWIADDWDSAEYHESQAILINATDLHLIREGGLDALVHHRLFKSF